jgi:hypothetical protein
MLRISALSQRRVRYLDGSALWPRERHAGIAQQAKVNARVNCKKYIPEFDFSSRGSWTVQSAREARAGEAGVRGGTFSSFSPSLFLTGSFTESCIQLVWQAGSSE